MTHREEVEQRNRTNNATGSLTITHLASGECQTKIEGTFPVDRLIYALEMVKLTTMQNQLLQQAMQAQAQQADRNRIVLPNGPLPPPPHG